MADVAPGAVRAVMPEAVRILAPHPVRAGFGIADPPRRIPGYHARHDLRRLARRFVFGTDWPGGPGVARNARAVASLGLDEETVSLVLGGNDLQIYKGPSL